MALRLTKAEQVAQDASLMRFIERGLSDEQIAEELRSQAYDIARFYGWNDKTRGVRLADAATAAARNLPNMRRLRAAVAMRSAKLEEPEERDAEQRDWEMLEREHAKGAHGFPFGE